MGWWGIAWEVMPGDTWLQPVLPVPLYGICEELLKILDFSCMLTWCVNAVLYVRVCTRVCVWESETHTPVY